jgi:chromosome partitioning protein
MIRVVCAQQRGGVAKTTTAVTLARCFADRGLKTLLIDTDPQGSVSSILRVKPQFFLYDFLIAEYALKECVVSAHERVDVLCSSRKTQQAEDIIATQQTRDVMFERALADSGADAEYQAVIIDVAPSFSWFQTCGMIYARHVLTPVAMEALSVQGAVASISAAMELNQLFKRPEPIRVIGLLPVIVNNRLAMTEPIMESLRRLSQQRDVPLLPAIRTDTAVVKAAKDRVFLADYDTKSKALEDYQSVADLLITRFQESGELARASA